MPYRDSCEADSLNMEMYILFMIPCIWTLDATTLPISNLPYITIAGYPNAPQCEYASCYNSDQCGFTPARMNPNFTHNTNAMSPCSCDSSCLLYGDCCFDYFETCLGSNISDFSKSETFKGMESTLLKEEKVLQYKECTGKGIGSLYWTIPGCSRDGATDDDILDCEVEGRTVIGKVPVTLIENPTIIFANYYCARCHGFERNMVRFWSTGLHCNKTVDLTGMSFTQVQKLILFGTCWADSQPNPEDKPRLCNKDFTNVEPITTVALNYDSVSTEYTSSSTTDTLMSSHTGSRGPTFLTPPLATTIPPEILLEDFGKLCSFYTYPVIDRNNVMYQNAHCALSVQGRGILDTPLTCAWQGKALGSMGQGGAMSHLTAGTTPYHNAPTALPTFHAVNSFSMMFNFGANEMSLDISGRVLRSETRLCLREDEVFNIYSHKCVTLLCDGMDMRPVNGTCLLKDKQVVNGTRQLYPKGARRFTIILSVRGKETLMKTFVRKKLKRYLQQFLSDRNSISHNVSINITNLMKSRVYSGVVTNNVSVNRLASYTYQVCVETNAQVGTLINSTGYLFREILKTLSHHNVRAFDFYLNDLKKPNSPVLQTISEYYEYVSNSTEVCPNEHVLKMFQDVELITVRDSYFARLNRTYFRLNNIMFEMRFMDSGTVPNLTDIIVCVPDLGNQSLHCPNGTLSIHPSEFSLLNDSLRYIPSGVVLPARNFSLTRHGAVICSQFSRSHTEQVIFFDYTNAQVVLAIGTSSVSVASLVGVLLVYSLLPQLRNVPGKVVMSLSATLLVAQGLQLITKVPTGQMCVAVASFTHVLWLSSFLWMSLLSIDLARSLRSMSPVSGIQCHNKLCCLYACLGWGIPIILVVTCVVIDHFHVWGISIGYGSGHVCWIANPKASLYVFGLPVALTLAINVTCFMLTLISIERTASQVSSNSKSCKNEKTRLGIYVRLSFIMGFSWIFCFVAAFAHVNILWYFQIVLNGLQGFYIFVCFVCKSRILKLLKDKLYSVHKKVQRKDMNATTTTS